MPKRVEFLAAVLADLLGATGALLIANRHWQAILTPRPRPLADDVLGVTGRTLDAATTALSLVALAGVVAVLATRGAARRIVGAVLAIAAGMLVWRSFAGLSAVSPDRARSLVRQHHSGVGVDATVVPHVSVHAQWPVLSAVCGLLILAAGLFVAVRGSRWGSMSARYEAPTGRQPSAGKESAEDLAARRARADASMWTALDRGDDPTTHAGR